VRGLAYSLPAGLRVRVASTSFDDFLPTALFEAHPGWFAERGSGREPRGNFCLSCAEARAACLDAVGAWLDAHPEAEALGLWPEVTEAWCACPDCSAAGRPASYAGLWREAAARFPARRIEILATASTLHPPEGAVPANVDVRLRPGRDGCGLHGACDPACPRNLDAVVRAWEARGARPLIEIDAAPDSWCGMPWPCEEAVRADSFRFSALVLRRPTPALARLWRMPRDVAVPMQHSSGDPRDAADFDFPESEPLAFRIMANERAFRAAVDPAREAGFRREQATQAWTGFHALPETYRRHREADFRRMAEALFPDGIVRTVGPATVRETPSRVVVETGLLRLGIDVRTAAVTSLERKGAKEWGPDLAGGDGAFFSVVAVEGRVEREAGSVVVSSPEPGRVRIELSGRLSRGGPRWRSTLETGSASPVVSQAAALEGEGAMAVGCRWRAGLFDRWICPAHAAEGALTGREAPVALWLPPGSLLCCRAGDTGPGLAMRLPEGGRVSLADGARPSVAAVSRGRELRADWILFETAAELGR
jgi:hypothetical protein